MAMRALGYADPAYVDSLRECGEPKHLAASGGGILVRSVPGSDLVDAMGSYRIFDCLDWSAFPRDLDELRGQLVSLMVISDAFADDAHDVLASTGPDRFELYKEHYVIDLRIDEPDIGRRSRRRTATKAFEALEYEAVPGKDADLEEWVSLYDNVIHRHSATGMAAFSPTIMAAQLSLVGAELITARHSGVLVAAQLCLRRDDVVYSHLAASSPEGYRLRAMHGLDLFAIRHFATTATWFDLGGGNGRVDDGLAAYKSTWATGTRPTWLAGWVFDVDAYDKAVSLTGTCDSTFFPAYRDPSVSQ